MPLNLTTYYNRSYTQLNNTLFYIFCSFSLFPLFFANIFKPIAIFITNLQMTYLFYNKLTIQGTIITVKIPVTTIASELIAA